MSYETRFYPEDAAQADGITAALDSAFTLGVPASAKPDSRHRPDPKTGLPQWDAMPLRLSAATGRVAGAESTWGGWKCDEHGALFLYIETTAGTMQSYGWYPTAVFGALHEAGFRARAIGWDNVPDMLVGDELDAYMRRSMRETVERNLLGPERDDVSWAQRGARQVARGVYGAELDWRWAQAQSVRDAVFAAATRVPRRAPRDAHVREL